MSGVLLDTHALLWLCKPAPMSIDALLAIEQAAQSNELYVSPISAWELGAAVRKKNPAQRPELGELSVADWFIKAMSSLGALSSPVTEAVGLAASALPNIYNSSDPGDCFLMATAHINDFVFITRDQHILEFARANSMYMRTARC